MYHMNSYYSTYAENVFPAGREALTTGKFHDMFMAGDGHELEDSVGKDGRLLPAHAKSFFSSSMSSSLRYEIIIRINTNITMIST